MKSAKRGLIYMAMIMLMMVGTAMFMEKITTPKEPADKPAFLEDIKGIFSFAIDQEGNIYVKTSDSVIKYDGKGKKISSIPVQNESTVPNMPWRGSFAVDKNGNVYVLQGYYLH